MIGVFMEYVRSWYALHIELFSWPISNVCLFVAAAELCVSCGVSWPHSFFEKPLQNIHICVRILPKYAL
jgi:hypothetical protein